MGQGNGLLLSAAAIVPFPKKLANCTTEFPCFPSHSGQDLQQGAPEVWTASTVHRSPFTTQPTWLSLRKINSARILSIRRILEECLIRNKSAAMVFVDFSKAFDSINREAMFHILHLYGIPSPIVQAPSNWCTSNPTRGSALLMVW